MKFDVGIDNLTLKWNSCKLSDGILPWFVCCLLGGMLTGYIGVAIEKVMFILITLNPLVDIRSATVTSITVVGWVSALAFLMHAMSPCDPNAPQYIGAVPYHLWLLALPGILIGSVLGPTLNSAVGSRNIMLLFIAMLMLEILHNTLHLFKDWNSSTMETCVPQHEDMHLGHTVVQFIPWLLSREHADYMANTFMNLASQWKSTNASDI